VKLFGISEPLVKTNNEVYSYRSPIPLRLLLVLLLLSTANADDTTFKNLIIFFQGNDNKGDVIAKHFEFEAFKTNKCYWEQEENERWLFVMFSGDLARK
jgi:hypothetical protein